MKNITATLQHIQATHLAIATFVAIICSLFFYAYFVNATVMHTAARQDVQNEIIDLKSSISDMELALLEAEQEITESYAYTIGFEDATALVFVERDPTQRLTLNEVQP